MHVLHSSAPDRTMPGKRPARLTGVLGRGNFFEDMRPCFSFLGEASQASALADKVLTMQCQGTLEAWRFRARSGHMIGRIKTITGGCIARSVVGSNGGSQRGTVRAGVLRQPANVVSCLRRGLGGCSESGETCDRQLRQKTCDLAQELRHISTDRGDCSTACQSCTWNGSNGECRAPFSGGSCTGRSSTGSCEVPLHADAINTAST